MSQPALTDRGSSSRESDSSLLQNSSAGSWRTEPIRPSGGGLNLAVAPHKGPQRIETPRELRFASTGVEANSKSGFVVHSEAAQERPRPQVADGKIRSVDGVVMHVALESVRCEFFQGQSSSNVWLPRSLFPSVLNVGFTFSISVENEGGYRTPRIVPRPPNVDQGVRTRLDAVLSYLNR